MELKTARIDFFSPFNQFFLELTYGISQIQPAQYSNSAIELQSWDCDGKTHNNVKYFWHNRMMHYGRRHSALFRAAASRLRRHKTTSHFCATAEKRQPLKARRAHNFIHTFIGFSVSRRWACTWLALHSKVSKQVSAIDFLGKTLATFWFMCTFVVCVCTATDAVWGDSAHNATSGRSCMLSLRLVSLHWCLFDDIVHLDSHLKNIASTFSALSKLHIVPCWKSSIHCFAHINCIRKCFLREGETKLANALVRTRFPCEGEMQVVFITFASFACKMNNVHQPKWSS